MPVLIYCAVMRAVPTLPPVSYTHLHSLNLICPDLLHHSLKLRTVDVSARESLVLKNEYVIFRYIVMMELDMLTAKLNLVFNTFALAGKL